MLKGKSSVKIIDVKSLEIPDVKVVRFSRFRDHRGYFTETFRKSDLTNHPEIASMRDFEIVQCNESRSVENTVRGLHSQWNPYMGKLVRTLRGRMVDMVLDIRKGSPTFGKIIAYDMPATDDKDYAEWIWVPPGFAHGNLLTEPTTVEYLCSGQYSPGCEACISPLADDIDWSLCDRELERLFRKVTADSSLVISEKDANGLSMSLWRNDDRSSNFVYGQC